MLAAASVSALAPREPVWHRQARAMWAEGETVAAIQQEFRNPMEEVLAALRPAFEASPKAAARRLFAEGYTVAEIERVTGRAARSVVASLTAGRRPAGANPAARGSEYGRARAVEFARLRDEEGLTLAQIGERCDCSAAAVAVALSRHGLALTGEALAARLRRPRKLPPAVLERAERVRKLARAGMEKRDIAKTIGCHVDTVSNILSRGAADA